MGEKALCKLCGEPVDLTPEHIKFHGTENWVHQICHRKDTAALRSHHMSKDKSIEDS